MERESRRDGKISERERVKDGMVYWDCLVGV
jgi:hypothetical protein